MTRYVIIGTGVAAIAAAEAIRRADKSGEIVLVGDDPHGYYSRPGLAYYLTSEVTGSLLQAYPPKATQELRAQFLRGRVARINADAHMIEIAGMGTQSYDRLLIATGASAVRLQIPGAELHGVVKLDHLEDAKRIVGLARHSRSAVVVGGGITALELVEGLTAQGLRVHYLLRGDRYWGNVLDEAESRVVEGRLRDQGVVLHFNTELAEVQSRKTLFGRTQKVGSVRTTSGEIIKCELLAYAIGVVPQTALAREAGIRCDKGILTNEYMETSARAVFAAGDVAQVFDPATGKAVIDSLWSPAREQGAAAGRAMAGHRIPYVKPSPLNVTRLAGLTTTIIGTVGTGQDTDVHGIARGDSETWRHIPDAMVAQGGFDVNRLRLMVGKRTLLGAVVMGDQTLSMVVETMVREGVDITSIHDPLLEEGAPVAEILANFWTEWKQRAR